MFSHIDGLISENKVSLEVKQCSKYDFFLFLNINKWSWCARSRKKMNSASQKLRQRKKKVSYLLVLGMIFLSQVT